MVMKVGEAKQEEQELKTSLCYMLREGRKGEKETERQVMRNKRRLFCGRENSQERGIDFHKTELDVSEKPKADAGCLCCLCFGPLLLLLSACYLCAC